MNVKQEPISNAGQNQSNKQIVGFRKVSSVWNLDLQSFLRRNREFKQQINDGDG